MSEGFYVLMKANIYIMGPIGNMIGNSIFSYFMKYVGYMYLCHERIATTCAKLLFRNGENVDIIIVFPEMNSAAQEQTIEAPQFCQFSVCIKNSH